MSFYVKDALDRGSPVDLADNVKAAALGTMLSNLCNPITENVTVNANVGTLAYLPSKIESIYQTAAATKGCIVVPAGIVPNAGECAVDFAAKTITFAAADNCTAATVVYHKCAEKANLLLAAVDVR